MVKGVLHLKKNLVNCDQEGRGDVKKYFLEIFDKNWWEMRGGGAFIIFLYICIYIKNFIIASENT